jgi:ribonuclease Z
VATDHFDLILLGTGAAFPPTDRENTSLALAWPGGVWLVDCGASPHRRLRAAGLDPNDLCGVLITHGHPDHLYGLPSLIHCLLPARRAEPLPILAPPEGIEQARKILDAFHLLEREEIDLVLVELSLEDSVVTPVLHVDGLSLGTAPVSHGPQTVGVRAEAEGRILAYSSDTMPCEGVAVLANGAHLLVHEATFSERDREHLPKGHSTARDAGRAASAAGVETLVLVHFLEETLTDPVALGREAEEVFSGRVEIGHDLGRYIV